MNGLFLNLTALSVLVVGFNLNAEASPDLSPLGSFKATHLASGAEGFCAVAADRSGVRCFNDLQSQEVRIHHELDSIRVKKLVANQTGGYCALDDQGSIRCWGVLGNTPTLQSVRDLVATDDAFCALLSGSSMVCWGHYGYALPSEDETALQPPSNWKLRRLETHGNYISALGTDELGALVVWSCRASIWGTQCESISPSTYDPFELNTYPLPKNRYNYSNFFEIQGSLCGVSRNGSRLDCFQLPIPAQRNSMRLASWTTFIGESIDVVPASPSFAQSNTVCWIQRNDQTVHCRQIDP